MVRIADYGKIRVRVVVKARVTVRETIMVNAFQNPKP